MKTLQSLEELRKLGEKVKGSCFTGVHCDAVLSLADEIQAEIDERFMELPVDADGVPIHLYDKLLKSTGALKPTYGEVVGISDDSVFFNAKQGWESNWSKLTRHVKPDSLKELLSDAALAIIDVGYQNVSTIGNVPKLSVDDFRLDEWLEENSERIRKLMKEGGE